ncbi:MAG: hypothetical protein PVS3B3_30610 [Ktedonobacteraceae bacterium]
MGLFVFKPDDQTVEVGLGLRPDLTRKGLGRVFLTTGLTFGQEHFSVEMWSLSVATFNTRAIHLYEQVGFTPLNTFLHHTNGGEYEFLRDRRTVQKRLVHRREKLGWEVSLTPTSQAI